MREYPTLTYFLEEDEETLIKVGVILSGNARHDAIRKSQLRAAEPRIKAWLNEVKHRLDALQLKPIRFDVFFSLVDTGTLGRAVLEDDFTYWFKLSSSYLSGKNLKSSEAVSTFIHEWAHIWLFRQSSLSNEKPLEFIRENLSDLRKKHSKSKDKAIQYALKDDDGDELFAYTIQYYDIAPLDFKLLVDAAISLGR